MRERRRSCSALLGWAPPPGVDDIGLAQLNLSDVGARIDELTELRSQRERRPTRISRSVSPRWSARLWTPTRTSSSSSTRFRRRRSTSAATGIRDQFFDRVADLLTIHAIGSIVPAAIPVGALLGVFEFRQLPADPAIFQVKHVRQVVRWDRLSTLFTDPDPVDARRLRLGNCRISAATCSSATSAASSSTSQPMPRRGRCRARPRNSSPAGRSPKPISIRPRSCSSASTRASAPTAFDAGLTLYPLRPSTPGAADGGIGLSPYVFGTAETSFSSVRQPLAGAVGVRSAGGRHRAPASRGTGSEVPDRADRRRSRHIRLAGRRVHDGAPQRRRGRRTADALLRAKRRLRRRGGHRGARHHRRSQSVGALQARRRPHPHRARTARMASWGRSFRTRGSRRRWISRRAGRIATA